jgi:pimeloyl-ACP methyl ester carboxylesterase
MAFSHFSHDSRKSCQDSFSAYLFPNRLFVVSNFLSLRKAKKMTDKKPTIVLLHGFCMDASIWDAVIEDLNSDDILKIDYSTLVRKEHFLIEDLAARLGDYLVAENIEQCILIGHSMGGYIGLEMLDQYPELIAGLGLVNTHPFEDSEERKALRQKSISFINKFGATPYIKQAIPTWFAEEFTAAQPEKVQAIVMNALEKYNGDALVFSLEAMLHRNDCSEILREAEIPILFINGAKDATIPEELRMAQVHLPKVADIHTIVESAHMSLIESPKEVSTIINGFINLVSQKQ